MTSNATEQETKEIIAEMVRLFNIDENLMPDMMDKEDIIGNEDLTDEENAKYWLDQATVIINNDCGKNGVIFWGDSEYWFSVLTTDKEGKFRLMGKDDVEMVYWGKSLRR